MEEVSEDFIHIGMLLKLVVAELKACDVEVEAIESIVISFEVGQHKAKVVLEVKQILPTSFG